LTEPLKARATVTELKIPAQAAFVIVAKRAASALGSAAGFSLEGVDDLNIAVAQACEKAIAAGDRMWGAGNGVLKLTFNLVDAGIEVEVRNLPAKAAIVDEVTARHGLELKRQAEAYRRTAARLSEEVVAVRQSRMRAQAEAQRLSNINRRMAKPRRQAVEPETDPDLDDVAVNMIRLFVDELRYNVDSRGGMRMRMVKYHVD
jgi:hypothetical protein